MPPRVGKRLRGRAFGPLRPVLSREEASKSKLAVVTHRVTSIQQRKAVPHDKRLGVELVAIPRKKGPKYRLSCDKMPYEGEK
jgi:hypothetical protein